MEFAMKSPILCTTLGLALAAGTSLAHAQAFTAVVAPAGPMVIAQQPAVEPPPGVVVTQPPPGETVETVRTVTTTAVPARTVRRKVVRANAGGRVTTTRTIVRERAVPPAVVAPVAGVVQRPAVPTWTYPPIYDVVPGAAVVAPAGPPLVGSAVVTPVAPYHYVYEPDRILVIDDSTGIAVRSIPR
jgi:hypothetical protein